MMKALIEKFADKTSNFLELLRSLEKLNKCKTVAEFEDKTKVLRMLIMELQIETDQEKKREVLELLMKKAPYKLWKELANKAKECNGRMNKLPFAEIEKEIYSQKILEEQEKIYQPRDVNSKISSTEEGWRKANQANKTVNRLSKQTPGGLKDFVASVNKEHYMARVFGEGNDDFKSKAIKWFTGRNKNGLGYSIYVFLNSDIAKEVLGQVKFVEFKREFPDKIIAVAVVEKDETNANIQEYVYVLM